MPAFVAIPNWEQIEPIARKLAPDVVRIRLSSKPDWSGDPAIYFRVILSDEASRKERLPETAARVRTAIFDELDLASLDRIPYFKFRSESEQAVLREQAWE
jgi:hypothetical protein